ncbi:MAG: FAD-dependent oxidoreductase, partial [Actinomycetes bacterium]
MSSASQHSADVVIVGGGIGGLSNALALARGGYRVRLLEQAPEFGEVGAGLQMAPNATRILRSWGLLDQVVERGVLPRRLVFRDALDGSDLTHLDLGKGFQERYDAPYVVIHRSDLHNILLEGCREAGVELLTSSHVDDVLMVGSDAVALVGGQEYRADVVLAADGLNSSLRPRFSADEPVPSGYAAYRGAIPVADLPSTEYVSMQDVVVYFGPGCHFVQYPLRRGEIFNQVAVFRSPAFLRGEENWGGPEELEAAFAHCAPQVRAGLSVLWTDRYWPMYDRNPITSWVQGRLALTGDAAHPMLQYLAQGACQAIEDAAALASHAGPRGAAGELLWDDALKAYQAERTVRTARVQTTARLWGDIWHCDGLTRTLRNAVFRDRPI